MVISTAYWGTERYWQSVLAAEERGEAIATEAMESFPKQTCRNRSVIIDPRGEQIVLSVPVKKVEHKQLTRDIEISYQAKWQHQHWNAILSAYKRTPYFDYYQDFIRPLYEKETRWLIDFNDQTFSIVHALLQNEMPGRNYAPERTTDWAGQDLESVWGDGISILDALFRKGPLAGKEGGMEN